MDNFIRPGSEGNRERLGRAGMRPGTAMCATAPISNRSAADWVIDAAANPSVLAGVDGKSSAGNWWSISGRHAERARILQAARRRPGLLSSSRVYSVKALAGLPLRSHGDAFELDSDAPLPEGVTAAEIETGFSVEAPRSLYGSTKLASEILALEYADAFGFPVWVDRCGVLAGAGQFGTAEQGIFSFWDPLAPAAAPAALHRIRRLRAAKPRCAASPRPGRARPRTDDVRPGRRAAGLHGRRRSGKL